MGSVGAVRKICWVFVEAVDCPRRFHDEDRALGVSKTFCRSRKANWSEALRGREQGLWAFQTCIGFVLTKAARDASTTRTKLLGSKNMSAKSLENKKKEALPRP